MRSPAGTKRFGRGKKVVVIVTLTVVLVLFIAFVVRHKPGRVSGTLADVSPLDSGEVTVKVYLPAGRWVHAWSSNEYGSAIEGVWETVPAPIGEPALFYKEGSEAGERFRDELRQRNLL
jgi:hypothetical protein